MQDVKFRSATIDKSCIEQYRSRNLIIQFASSTVALFLNLMRTLTHFLLRLYRHQEQHGMSPYVQYPLFYPHTLLLLFSSYCICCLPFSAVACSITPIEDWMGTCDLHRKIALSHPTCLVSPRTLRRSNSLRTAVDSSVFGLKRFKAVIAVHCISTTTAYSILFHLRHMASESSGQYHFGEFPPSHNPLLSHRPAQHYVPLVPNKIWCQPVAETSTKPSSIQQFHQFRVVGSHAETLQRHFANS